MDDSPPPKLQPEAWLREHGDVLYRYALARTGQREVAQDIVQDTLLAAWAGRKSFHGEGHERTWLIGICRHKVLDHFRKKGQQDAGRTAWQPDSSDDGDFFNQNGSWRQPPGTWDHEPLDAAEAEDFLRVLQRCMAALPAAQRESFELRALTETTAQDASRILDVSPNHLYVLLHRARLRLRRCLEQHWFAPEEHQS